MPELRPLLMLCIRLSPQLGYSLLVETTASGFPLRAREATVLGSQLSQSKATNAPGPPGSPPPLPPAERLLQQEPPPPARGETWSPSPAFGAFPGLTPDPEHTTTLPKARAAAGPERRRLARKVPPSSRHLELAASQRASLCNFMSK